MKFRYLQSLLFSLLHTPIYIINVNSGKSHLYFYALMPTKLINVKVNEYES